METGAEFNVTPKTPYTLAPQPHQPAQKTRIDVGKTSKAAAAIALALKLRSFRASGSGDCS